MLLVIKAYMLLVIDFYVVNQWCSNRGPRATCGLQSPLEWPAKQFSLERKLDTLII